MVVNGGDPLVSSGGSDQRLLLVVVTTGENERNGKDKRWRAVNICEVKEEILGTRCVGGSRRNHFPCWTEEIQEAVKSKTKKLRSYGQDAKHWRLDWSTVRNGEERSLTGENRNKI